MSVPQVVACFEILSGEEIAYKGSFQVFDDQDVLAARSNDGGHFEFRHSYQGARVQVELSYTNDGVGKTSIDLSIPINRNKVKWKTGAIGDFEVRYRCVFQNIRESKERKKLQRRAALARRNRPKSEPNVFYRGGPEGDA